MTSRNSAVWSTAFVCLTVLICLYLTVYSRCAAAQTANGHPANDKLLYYQSGDPDAREDPIQIDQKAADNASRETSVSYKGPYKDARQIALDMTALAEDYASTPITRTYEGGKYVKQFISLYDFTDVDVSYCAMGVAFVACRAYCNARPSKPFTEVTQTDTLKSVLPDIRKYYFTPNPLCQVMVDRAKERKPGTCGSWISPRTALARRGWLVLYHWPGKRAGANHIGILSSDAKPSATHLNTVEFNTSGQANGNQVNGGAVFKKYRSISTVMGYIRTF